jgi:fucose 4-O-acetylase-like acetyltransferase
LRDNYIRSEKNKNFIDFMKGFAIFLVVLGHTIQINYTNFDDEFLFKFIYSFHMPIFILISGYLASKSLSTSGCNVEKCIFQKAFFLLVPYFTWYFVGFILAGTFSFSTIFDNLKLLIEDVDRGLWFLYVLFLLYCTLYISSKLKYKYIVLMIFILIIPMNKIFGMHLLKWYLIFFVMGMLIFDLRDFRIFIVSNKIVDSKIFKYSISILFIISLFFWERVYLNDSLFINVYYLFAYKFLVAILGMLFFYFICNFLFEIEFISSIFSLFGQNSLRIYILNFIFLAYLNELYPIQNYILLIIISFAISFFSIYLVSKLIKFYFFKIIFGEIRHINFIKK